MTRNIFWTAVIVLASSSSRLSGATICSGPGAGCTGTRSCRASIDVPSLGMTFQIDANGPAQASDFWSDQQAVLTWNTSQFSGNDPFLGSISISLSGLAPSTGDVVPFDQANCQPDCSNCFPALNTNHLFFRFEFSNPMVPTLLSIGPIDIQGKVHDIPPVGSVFHLVNGPVPLYAEGDATQTPIAFLNSAEVHFLPSSVPTVTTWGVAVMVLLSLTAGTILIRRRPPVAQRA